jgi:hypothetical protein
MVLGSKGLPDLGLTLVESNILTLTSRFFFGMNTIVELGVITGYSNLVEHPMVISAIKIYINMLWKVHRIDNTLIKSFE